MDNQNQQEKRKKGVVDYINDSRRALASIKRASSSLRAVNVALKTVGQIITKPFPWVWIVVIIILLIVIFQLFFGGGTGFSFDLDDSQNPNLPGAPGSGNISSCQYTRAGERHSIKSSILTGWINEAANSAGIPPAVLASLAMHENQNFLTTYDNNAPEIINGTFCGSEGISCTQNGQNIATRACTSVEIQNGAVTDRHRGLLQISSYFYPTVDACNIRESLTWAAIKLKDYILTSSPTEAQVKAAVAAYGGFSGQPCNTHAGYPYDYCGEVWQDYQSCQAPIIAPAPPSNIRQGLIDSFGITMDGFGEQHLRWAWEKFYETSNTRFPDLIRGITIAASDGGSSQVGCAESPVAVRLGQYTQGDFFKFILTHELGHVIQSCLPRAQSRFTDAINAYGAEGGISHYARTASDCNGTVNVNENYADIIAYYLNPNAGLASGPSRCGGPTNPPNPFFSGQTSFPLHFLVGETVLKEDI